MRCYLGGHHLRRTSGDTDGSSPFAFQRSQFDGYPEMSETISAHLRRILDLPQQPESQLRPQIYTIVDQMVEMKPGSAIVNTGSVTLLGSEFLLDYSMTNGGIHAFTRSLTTNLVARGLRVNAVTPGPVWTPLNSSDKRRKTFANSDRTRR